MERVRVCACARARSDPSPFPSRWLHVSNAIFTRRYTENNNDGAVVNIQGCNYSTIETNRAIGNRKGTKGGKKILNEGGMCPRYLEDCPVPLRGEGFLISSRSPPVFRSLRVGREWEELVQEFANAENTRRVQSASMRNDRVCKTRRTVWYPRFER